MPARRRDLRIAVAGVLVIGLIFNPFGSEAIDSLRGRNPAPCAELETEMHAAIDDYKYDDEVRWAAARGSIEDRYVELSCSFSTYGMYTSEGRL